MTSAWNFFYLSLQIKTRFSLSATISYQPSHFRRTHILASHHVPLYSDPKASFSQIYRKGLMNLLFFLSSFPGGYKKPFFIHLRTVLSSFTHKKLSSYYFRLVNECHNTAVNALYPSHITFKTNQSIPQRYTFSKTYVIVKNFFSGKFF